MAAQRRAAENKSADDEKGALYVSAPIVSAVTKGNRVVQFYKGDRLPEDVTEESLENLRSLGYVSDEPQQ